MTSLYQTLNKNLSSDGLTKVQKRKLCNFLSDVTDESTLSSIIMLIHEHYRLHTETQTLDFSNICIPYNGRNVEMNGVPHNVKFDLDDFPKELQIILWKFKKVLETKY